MIGPLAMFPRTNARELCKSDDTMNQYIMYGGSNAPMHIT